MVSFLSIKGATWLVTAIGLSLLALIARKVSAMWFLRNKSVSTLARPVDLKRLKEITQILVVDDDPNAFPVSLLQSEGYRITYWSKVENLAHMESGSYDIIVLDMAGVARAWSESEADGLAILRMIKHSNPGQYVISFSGQKAVHELGEFWKLSDNQLKKPISAEEAKVAIDEAIIARIGVTQYWSRIGEVLRAHGVSEKSIDRFEKEVVKQARDEDAPEGTLKGKLAQLVTSPKAQELLITLTSKLLSAASKKP